MIADLPALPGSYTLWMQLENPLCLVVGRLGQFSFPAGDYLYFGSAHGPGGLRARLNHHARVTVKPHWHLDWLRPHLMMMGGWWVIGHEDIECAWSQSATRLAGVSTPAPGFGAADCRLGCAAHLVLLSVGADFTTLADTLAMSLPEGVMLNRWLF